MSAGVIGWIIRNGDSYNSITVTAQNTGEVELLQKTDDGDQFVIVDGDAIPSLIEVLKNAQSLRPAKALGEQA